MVICLRKPETVARTLAVLGLQNDSIKWIPAIIRPRKPPLDLGNILKDIPFQLLFCQEVNLRVEKLIYRHSCNTNTQKPLRLHLE